MDEERLGRLGRIAVGMVVCGVAPALVAEYSEGARLLHEARLISGKSDEAIKAALAKTPYSLADFVRFLASGQIRID